MKSTNYALIRYDADDGKVFDWAEARYIEELIDESNPELGTKQVQEHLYATTLFIGSTDSNENYIENEKHVEE